MIEIPVSFETMPLVLWEGKVSKTCYFVVGPEGSGTYMLAEWLSAGGCKYISDEEELQERLQEETERKVVIRRSLPHAKKWIDIARIGRGINFGTDYDVVFIGIIRDQFATVASVHNRSFDVYDTELTLSRDRMLAIAKMSSIILAFRGEIITYESMVNNEGFRRRLWAYLDLEWHNYPEDYEFYNGNNKYYD